MTRACACGTALGRRNETGRCRSCSARRLATFPHIRQARAAGIRRKFATDPAYKAEHTARLYANSTTARAMQRRSEVSKITVRSVLLSPEVRARTHSPEANAKRVAAYMATTLPWLPADLIPDYRRFRKAGYTAAEARALIEDHITITARNEVLARQRAMAEKHARDLASRY